MNEQYREAMGKALFLANRARETGDVPVGAVVVDADGRIIGRGWNCREAHHDPTGHAEIVALREAARALGTWRLSGCTLIVTLEPCTMCAGAILASRVDRVVFGAWDPKAGAAGSMRDVLRDTRIPHPTEVIGGVLAQEAAMQLRSFFLGRRAANEMPVIEAPVNEPGDLPAPAPAKAARADKPAKASSPEEAPERAYPKHDAGTGQALLPATPASHRADTAAPLPRRAGRPFSERVSGNGDNPADIPVGQTITPIPVITDTPASQPPYRSAAPIMPAVSPNTTRGPITKSVPQIRPVHVRPTATVPPGLYTPAQPKRPATQPPHDTATQPPASTPQANEQPSTPVPAPPVFPQRAQQRTTARPQRPLPQAFEPDTARRVDYELSPRQFSDVDPVTSGIRVRRSSRRRGNARH